MTRMIIENGRKAYPADLTGSQWDLKPELFPQAGNKGKREQRKLVSAVLYIVRNGCKRRNLQRDFPPYQTAASFYCAAIKSGLREKIQAALVEITRKAAGRNPEPTYGTIDSQSVKTASPGEELKYSRREKNKGQESAHCG